MPVRFSTTLILLTYIFLMISCKPDVDFDQTLNLQTTITYNNEVLQFNKIYKWNDLDVKFLTFNLYYSVPLLNFDGDISIFKNEDYFLISESVSNWKISFSNENFPNQIHWGLGVNPERNTEQGKDAIEANLYPIGHPLSVANNMYWAWNPGYIFMKIEGRIDLNQNGNFNDIGETFSLHPGLDVNYKTVSRNLPIKSKGEIYKLTLSLDKILETYPLNNSDALNVHATSINSSSFPYAALLMNNLVDAISEIE